jgi:hypothetical protein
LSLKSARGWSDHAIDFTMTGVLMNGPALLARVREIASLDAIRNSSTEAPGDQLSDFAAIDPERREIRLEAPFYDLEDDLPFVEAAWPGWTLVISSGGPPGHFAHTGRPCPDDFVPTPKPPDPPPPTEAVRNASESYGSVSVARTKGKTLPKHSFKAQSRGLPNAMAGP